MACWNFTARVLGRLSTSVLQKSVPALLLSPRPTAAAYIITSKKHALGNCHTALYPKQYGHLRGAATTSPGDFNTEQYLLSIGVDCKNLTRERRSILNQDKSKIQDVVDCLKNSGFTMEEIVRMLSTTPLLVQLEVSEIQKHVELFADLGLKTADMVKIKHLVFFTELDIVKGHIQNMKNLLVASPSWICSLMKYKPGVFKAPDPDQSHANIVMMKDLLMKNGCTEPNKILCQAMRNDYRLFNISEEKIMLTVQFLAEKGIVGVDLVYVINKCANIFQCKPKELEHRLHNLKQKLLLNDSEVIQLVLRYPRALGMKSKNLDKHIDFFLQRGIAASYIVEYPHVLWVSIATLESRYEERKEAVLFATPDLIRSSLSSMTASKKHFQELMDDIAAKKKKASKKTHDANKEKAKSKEESHAVSK